MFIITIWSKKVKQYVSKIQLPFIIANYLVIQTKTGKKFI